MTNEIICRLLDTNSFKLRINELLPTYVLLKKLFSCNNIAHETWYPAQKIKPEIITMSFSANCKFQDVYLISLIIKEFGLELIYPSRKEEPEISIGTYVYDFDTMGKIALAMPIDIDTFLLIDPKLSTQTVIDSAFKDHLTYESHEGPMYENEYYSSQYSQYGGYNGYDDDTIDSAFDGIPEATWNID